MQISIFGGLLKRMWKLHICLISEIQEEIYLRNEGKFNHKFSSKKNYQVIINFMQISALLLRKLVSVLHHHIETTGIKETQSLSNI